MACKMRTRHGMALVIVLTLATAIMVLGVSYLKTIRNQSGRNTIELGAIQADLLAEGITQIAMLKFKEIPGPLYYAYIASVKGNTDDPLDVYHGDGILAGDLETPFKADYRTTYQLLPSKMYEDMNIKITVVVNVARNDGIGYQRSIERTVTGARRPAF
ncbi:MAG: hypothetical protein PHV05_02080 [Candidatus Riflebacteria bacterium]|nr:hypothetical protein [Candidatus Riflebacteria bacterium]